MGITQQSAIQTPKMPRKPAWNKDLPFSNLPISGQIQDAAARCLVRVLDSICVPQKKLQNSKFDLTTTPAIPAPL
jgi:hypothetical protein